MKYSEYQTHSCILYFCFFCFAQDLKSFAENLPNNNATVFEGSTAVITCATPDGRPQPVVEWERNGRRWILGGKAT